VNNIERVREILALADQMNVDELIERFADDAVMELPFAPGKMRKRYDGLDAVRGFQEFARDSFSSFAMAVDAVWETSDPHVVVAEHHSNGVVAANGRTYQNRYVTFFTFDDAGKVTEWREYYDAGVVVRAFRPSQSRRCCSRRAARRHRSRRHRSSPRRCARPTARPRAPSLRPRRRTR